MDLAWRSCSSRIGTTYQESGVRACSRSGSVSCEISYWSYAWLFMELITPYRMIGMNG